MKNKNRLAKLEKQSGRKSESRRNVVEVGGRYFDLTADMKKPFTYDRVIRSMTWTAQEYAAAGYPEMTAADYADLTRRGLNDCVQIEFERLLTPNGL